MFNLIIIDDDVMALKNLYEFLKTNIDFLNVKEKFDDGEKAIEYIKANKPDAVMCDIKMPKPDGLDIAKFCYQQSPSIPVILISAYRDFEYAKKALEFDVFRYIQKPLNFPEMLKALKDLNKKLITKEPTLHFWENSIFHERHKIFSNLLCGVIGNVDELQKELSDNDININVYTSRCVTLYFHIDNFEDYIHNIWKHDLTSLYEAISRITPQDTKEIVYVFTRYSWSNLEFMLIVNNENIDLKKETETFSNLLISELKSLLNLSVCLTSYSKFQNIFSIMKTHVNTSMDNQSKNMIIEKAIEYINNNYSENTNLVTVAAQIPMNPSYFSAYFKQITGKKFVDYITDFRMKKAEELIKENKLSIQEICNTVGYKNLSHFYNIFRQHYNCTPADYRKEIKNK